MRFFIEKNFGWYPVWGVSIREQRSRARSRRGGVSENQIAGAAAARLFFLTAVAIARATRPFKFHEISVSNTSSSFVSSIHSLAGASLCKTHTVTPSHKINFQFPSADALAEPDNDNLEAGVVFLKSKNCFFSIELLNADITWWTLRFLKVLPKWEQISRSTQYHC